MDGLLKKILKELIDDYGMGILDDPDRLSQFMEDRCPSCRTGIFRLTFALGHLVKYGWSPQVHLSSKDTSKYVTMLCKNLSFKRSDAEEIMSILKDVTFPYVDDLSDEKVFAATPGNLKRISGGISTKPRTMWMRRKSFYNGLILVVSLIAIAVLFFQIGGQRTPLGDEFRIAFFEHLDGPKAQEGHNRLRAAQLAVELINRQGGIRGYKLKIVGFNTPDNPEEAALYVRDVMKDKSILVMMTGMDYKIIEKIAPIADAIEVPLVVTTKDMMNDSISDGAKPLLYVFSIVNDLSARAKMLAYFAMQGLSGKTIGIIYNSENEMDVAEHDELLRWIKIFGGTVKADIGKTSADGSDYTNAAGAITESGAEQLIIPGGISRIPGVLAQFRTAGFSGPILAEDYTEFPAESHQNVYVANSWWINELSSLDPQIRSVLKDYRSLYNENCPNEDVKSVILAYDGVKWIANSLSNAPGYRGEAIRHALLATRNFQMTHATLSIDPRSHAPLNKSMTLIYCDSSKGIFQKRIRARKD